MANRIQLFDRLSNKPVTVESDSVLVVTTANISKPPTAEQMAANPKLRYTPELACGFGGMVSTGRMAWLNGLQNAALDKWVALVGAAQTRNGSWQVAENSGTGLVLLLTGTVVKLNSGNQAFSPDGGTYVVTSDQAPHFISARQKIVAALGEGIRPIDVVDEATAEVASSILA